MKHAFRKIAWSLGAAALVAGLATEASAAERRDAGRQPVAVAPDAGEPTAIDRLAATRAQFHAILVDAGLTNGDVATIMVNVDTLTEHLARISVENPDELGGRSMEDVLQAKTSDFLAQWGVASTTVDHLSALAQNWATERMAADLEVMAMIAAAPAVEGSLR